MNKVILMGRFTRDPEVRYSTGDSTMAIAKFSLAVDRRRRQNAGPDDQTADFISCTAFSKQAEFIEKYFRKGMKAAIVGHIQTGSYMKGEVKIYTTDVIIDEIEFAESKNSSGSSSGLEAYADSAPQPAGAADGFMPIPDGIDDVLPFA